MRGFSTRAAGLLVLLGGLWGGLAPFIGPYWHFTLGPDKTWTWTTGRLWLDVIPGAVAVLAGLMLIGAGPRPHARLGALLGLAAGIWFTIGPAISELWTQGGAQGVGHGSAHARMLENLTFHTGLGVLMAAVAAYILPRFPARAVAADGVAAADRRGARRRGYVEDERGYGERGYAGNDPAYAEGERGRHHRGRDLAAGAVAGGAAGAALEHHHDRRVEEREARQAEMDRTAAVDDRSGDRTAAMGAEPVGERTRMGDRADGGFADRDRTSELGDEVGANRAAQTTGAGTTGSQSGEVRQDELQSGEVRPVGMQPGTTGATTTGATTARDDATTVGDTGTGADGAAADGEPVGATTDQPGMTGQGGGTIADRRQTVRRRRGGLLGMLTRR